jgi:hypothetical protein
MPRSVLRRSMTVFRGRRRRRWRCGMMIDH